MSDPLAKCLYHLVKRQLLIPFYSFTINSIHCKLCLLNHCHLPLLSWHGRIYIYKVSVKSEYDSHTQFDSITMVEYVSFSCFMDYPVKNCDLLEDALQKRILVELLMVNLSDMWQFFNIVRPQVGWCYWCCEKCPHNMNNQSIEK